MESRLNPEMFENVLALAIEGAAQLHSVMDNIIRERTLRLLNARGT